jgi:hypothetical protein
MSDEKDGLEKTLTKNFGFCSHGKGPNVARIMKLTGIKVHQRS